MTGSGKYDALAERFTAHEYGDPGSYFGRRAELVVSLGPRLEPGDLVVDLACADGSFAAPLEARGLRYAGVDASDRMVEVARGRGVDARVGDLEAFVPDEDAAAVTIFRTLHLVPDRQAFFAHVAGYASVKLVFDVDPRRYSLPQLRAELAEAGLPSVAVHPFFVPQHRALPPPAARALRAAERIPLLARALLAVRFNVLVAASRDAAVRASASPR